MDSVTGPVGDHLLTQLRRDFAARNGRPGWTISEDDDGGYTALRDDGKVSVTGRSVAELRVLLEGEAWKPLTGRNPGLPERM